MEGRSFLCHATGALLVLIFLTTCPGLGLALPTTVPFKTNTDYIRKSCNTTLYPQLCYNSLCSYASKIQTNPKRLAETALSLSCSATRSMLSKMENISKTSKLSPRESAAMRDCLEVLGDSIDELDKSMKEMSQISPGPNFEFQIENVQTWVSAALTDHDTCMDGYSGYSMNGEVKDQVRKLVLKVEHLTSVALALINNYASI